MDIKKDFFFVIYSTTNVYVTIVCVRQNVQWLIEEKDCCWEGDRAVVFVAGRSRFESRHVFIAVLPGSNGIVSSKLIRIQKDKKWKLVFL